MNESLWLDEATTALVAKMSLGDIFTKFLPGDFHPPFYYLLMKYWVEVFGNSEVSLRIPSLIFAILTVYLVYKLVGRVAALLLATAPLLFYYAQEGRMYAMTMFFVTLAIFSFVTLLRQGYEGRARVGLWILFSISLFLIGATDYVALLILPVFWYLGRELWKKLFVSHIILALFGVLWLPYFIRQLNAGLSVALVSPAWSQILGHASVKNLILIPIKFMIGRIGFEDKWLYGLIVTMVGGLFGYFLFRARKADKIYWLWLTVPILLGVIISFRVSVLTYFRFLFVLPAFYILVARGIGKSRSFLFSVLCVNLLFTIYYVLTPRFHREDWKGAAAAIGDEQIVLPADSQKEALIYYGKGDQIVTEPTEEEIWLSRYVWEVSDPSDDVRYKIEDQGYEKTGEYDFNGVVFWKYAHRN